MKNKKAKSIIPTYGIEKETTVCNKDGSSHTIHISVVWRDYKTYDQFAEIIEEVKKLAQSMLGENPNIENEQRNYNLTDKGLALIAAVESGLLPEIEGGWDDTKFAVFWDKYQTYLNERLLKENRTQN